MKEKNDYLNRKVNELKSTISSVTKEEMKLMIKEEIAPIVNILLGKEKEIIHTHTQTENVIIEEKQKVKVQSITKIEEVIQSEELDSYGCISSLIETEDKRIASGGYDGNISISSYDVNNKKWKIDIFKEDAHYGCMNSLYTLKGNKLLSSSDSDYSIKIWTISDMGITLIKELKEHNYILQQVIPLSQRRFVSCSNDGIVRIWKDDDANECLSILKHNSMIKFILQLKDKEVLVSCDYESGISFWNLNNYTKLHTIEGYTVECSTHIIELFDGNIALSSKNEPYPIVIIDSSTYKVKKEIILKEYITYCSSLCVFNQQSFIYSCDGTILQISGEDYSILFKSKGGNFDGYKGIIAIEGGNYFAIQNVSKISIIKLYWI